jgi:hypothetical protein
VGASEHAAKQPLRATNQTRTRSWPKNFGDGEGDAFLSETDADGEADSCASGSFNCGLTADCPCLLLPDCCFQSGKHPICSTCREIVSIREVAK